MSTPDKSPLSRPVDLVLHIGSGKTGTSSIHRFLDVNRDRLAEMDWLYPRSPGRGRHAQLGLYVRSSERLDGMPSWHRLKFDDPRRFRLAFRRRLFREIEESGLHQVLLSDEGLYGLAGPALSRLRQFTDLLARSLRIVVYLRRQEEHLLSRYQQTVKVGEVRRLTDWAAEDRSATYDYRARLGAWQGNLEPDLLVVRRFERNRFSGGSLLKDFTEACGMDIPVDAMEPTEDRNASLDAERVEFLRLLNIHRIENEGVEVVRIDNRAVVERLAQGSRGPMLTLPAATLDAFSARWEESNRAVARQFFPEEGDELFAPGHDSRSGTVQQKLDPDRLPLLLALASLPEELNAPLSRIAEREAGAALPCTPPASPRTGDTWSSPGSTSAA
jgi:hypothetical protein